ncbi:single-stranded DNA-binding protein [Fibrobacter sp.]|uniref:single-stranded DNA-binding protein n=1 Tax=Fibrobacter sp. TaxID=35828 RepID=UPI0025C304EC|nr:single-stranded DNA-binding protein [Fibrobacter sp.]
MMLIGNIGKDPEIRMSQTGGRKRVAFSLATSRRYRDNNGEQKEQTDWHNIVGWGKIADIVEQLGIRKGMSLYVEGTLTNRSWTDQNGQKRYATEVNMDTFQLLGPRGQGGAPGAAPASSYNQQNSYSPAQNSAPAYDTPMDGDGDDLPF